MLSAYNTPLYSLTSSSSSIRQSNSLIDTNVGLTMAANNNKNKLAFLSMPAPASYVAGLGRG